MFRLIQTARQLRKLGILGMNERNAAYILGHNPRRYFPVVDDKRRMRDLCARIGVPSPAIHASIGCYGELKMLGTTLGSLQDFVIKPNHGSAGRGVLVLVGRAGAGFVRHNGESMSLDQLRQHVSDILSGLYSLGGQSDEALVQQRVLLHPAFEPVAYKGIPDVRVILYRGQPAMAMLRLPTRASGGRANLHQGGIGTGIDLDTGITHHAVLHDRAVRYHPDTGAPVVGLQVPFWPAILEMARRVAGVVGLGYLGVDIVIDAHGGPMLLEANARPGLAIQIANGQGLRAKLQEIDAMGTQASKRNEGRRVA